LAFSRYLNLKANDVLKKKQVYHAHHDLAKNIVRNKGDDGLSLSYSTSVKSQSILPVLPDMGFGNGMGHGRGQSFEMISTMFPQRAIGNSIEMGGSIGKSMKITYK
jgi:hypothetical protein